METRSWRIGRNARNCESRLQWLAIRGEVGNPAHSRSRRREAAAGKTEIENRVKMNIISSVTPEMAKTGNYGGSDILTELCLRCDTEEDALIVAKRIVELGYRYNTNVNSSYNDMFNKKRWRLLYFCEKKKFFGRFKSINEFFMGFQHDPSEYRAFLSRKHFARNASIALIGVGKQRKRESGALDAMRIIARVAYSGWQLEEKWEIPPTPAPAAAKRRRGKTEIILKN
jgi:hypothetical protein